MNIIKKNFFRNATINFNYFNRSQFISQISKENEIKSHFNIKNDFFKNITNEKSNLINNLFLKNVFGSIKYECKYKKAEQAKRKRRKRKTGNQTKVRTH